MSTKVSQNHVKELVKLGFSKSKSEKALKDYGNNFNQAKSYLLRVKQEEEAKNQKEAELKEKIRLEEERKKKQERERKEADANKKFEAELAQAIENSMAGHEKITNNDHNNNFRANGDGYDEEAEDEDDDEMDYHPCIYQYGKCRYGDRCAWREFPGDSCINYLQGTCVFGDQCRNRHFWKGYDLREGLRPFHDPIEIQDPNDPSSLIVIPRRVADHATVIVAERKKNENYHAPTSFDDAPPPELHRFNPEATSKPSYSQPKNSNDQQQHEDGNEEDHDHDGDDEYTRRTPFLDKMKQIPSTKNGAFKVSSSSAHQSQSHPTVIASSIADNIVNNLMRETRNGQAVAGGEKRGGLISIKIPKHPCVHQRGSCKYGDTCVHADLPGDICVHWLNSRCKFDEETCRYKHHYLMSDDERAEHLRKKKLQEEAEKMNGGVDNKSHQQKQQQQHEPLLNLGGSASSLSLQQPASMLMPPVVVADHSSVTSTSNSIQRQLLDILGATNVSAGESVKNTTTSSSSTTATFGGFNISSSSSSLWSSSHPQNQLVNANTNSGNDKIRSDDNNNNSNDEKDKFESLRSAFPQVEPSAILLALRRCNGDVKRAGSCVLDLVEGAEEYVSEELNHEQEQEGSYGKNSSSKSNIVSDENKTIALVLLSSLCSSFEPEALREILENNNWNFEDAFAEANALLEEEKKKKVLTVKKITSSTARHLREKMQEQQQQQQRNATNNTKRSVWFSSQSSSSSVTSPQKLTGSVKLQLEKLVAMYTELDAAVIEHAFRACDLNVDTTRSLLLQMTEDCKEFTKKQMAERVRLREQISRGLLSSTPDEKKTKSPSTSSKPSTPVIYGRNDDDDALSFDTAAEFLWRGGGNSIIDEESTTFTTRQSRLVNEALQQTYNNNNTSNDSSSYQQAKESFESDFDWRRARQEATLTNATRQRTAQCAVTAFSRGDHQTGAALMQESKKLAARYSKLNLLCMSALEREQENRNHYSTNSSALSSSKCTSTLDLHGFQVREALTIVGRRLSLCREKNIPRLRIICGKGSHSREGRAVLLPAVKEYLDKLSVEQQQQRNPSSSSSSSWCFPVKNDSLFYDQGIIDVAIKQTMF